MSEKRPPLAGEALPSAGAAAPAAADEIEEYEPLTPELVEDEAIRGDFVMKWAVVLLAFLLGSTRIGESATLVHVKTGQYLASHGFLPPANDVFSYTASDRPWTNLSWGFDLLAAGTHAAAGFVGLSLAKAALAALIFGLIVHVSRPDAPTWWGSVCAVLALLACHLRLAAQPALITFLGTAVVLWTIHRSRQTPGAKPGLWALPVVFFLWSNLDPRAFLGLALVFLYAIGESLQRRRRFGTEPPAVAARTIWQVLGASIVAMMLHPFGYKALMAAVSVYGVEYPAFRQYILGSAPGSAVSLTWPGLYYFPMTSGGFWGSLDLASIAGLLLLVTPAVLFALNSARMELWQLLMYVGCVGLAVACLHELAWASLVCAALATLNGQSWYRATCRQTYTTETSELLFSRGGRVITVLAFATIALFGGTGRLRDLRSSRSGFGLDPGLATQVSDLQRLLGGAKSFDDRAFNQLLSQGDALIWVGHKVFADSRVAIYHARDSRKNLLKAHAQARDALRPARTRSGETPVPRASRAWKPIFDDYNITHTVLRLVPESADFLTLLELLYDGDDEPGAEPVWELTGIGAVSAVLYRRDVSGLKLDDETREQYEEFLAGHAVDFHERAFKEEGPEILGRGDRVRPPSFYQRYFWSRKPDVTPEVQEARNLANLAALPLPRRFQDQSDALALLAIRQAQVGLALDPGSVSGYLALGQAYQILSQLDALRTLNGSRSPFSGTRYLQAVVSYQQALTADPDQQQAHAALAALYEGAQRPDLALRHLEARDEYLSKEAGGEEQQKVLAEVREKIGRLYERTAVFESDFDKLPPGIEGVQLRLNEAVGRGFILTALKELDEQVQLMNTSPEIDKLRIALLLEAGRIDDASDAAERLAQTGPTSGTSNWSYAVALCRLAESDYRRAIELWEDDVEHSEKTSLNNALVGLALRKVGGPWPFSTLRSALDLLHELPERQSALNLEIALAALESGQLKKAEERFREALRENPETLTRALVAYYLFQLTGEEIDVLPPSEIVPGLFAPEPGAEDE